MDECLNQMNSFVLCAGGSVVDNCTSDRTGCCYDVTSTHKSLLSFCKTPDNQKTTMMSFSTTLSHPIAPLSTESTAPISSNNFLLSTGETYAIQTTTTATLISNNLLQFTTEVIAIQTTTQSTQNTTHINNLTIITISLGVILLLIVLTLVLICIILSVVIIVKRHHQFQPGKCHINK